MVWVAMGGNLNRMVAVLMTWEACLMPWLTRTMTVELDLTDQISIYS